MSLLFYKEYCGAKIAEIEAVFSEKSLDYVDNFSVHFGWLGFSLRPFLKN